MPSGDRKRIIYVILNKFNHQGNSDDGDSSEGDEDDSDLSSESSETEYCTCANLIYD